LATAEPVLSPRYNGLRPVMVWAVVPFHAPVPLIGTPPWVNGGVPV